MPAMKNTCRMESRPESATCALHDSKALPVSLATVVAVRPQAYLMPAAIAAGVAWAGLA
jgi:hypothetical protein